MALLEPLFLAAALPRYAAIYAAVTAAALTCLDLRRVSKSFPGVRALQDVSLSLSAGEVLGIVGENGAGKSTLIKILGGILRPDAGELLIDGQPRIFRRVRDAISAGIALIHQELNLAPALTVAENLYLGKQPHRGPWWFPVTNRRKLCQDSSLELERVGLSVSPRAQLGRLDLARQQLVEIAKALADQSRILVFDEPTSSLSGPEADRLLGIIEELRRRGVAIIYVSHRLGEIQRIADRVVVLRDGRHVGTLSKSETTHDRLISLMVGRRLEFADRQGSAIRREAAGLEIKNLRLAPNSPEINFSIQPGEIVGFAGIVGAGRTEVARAVFGITRRHAGEIRVHGQVVRIASPVDAIRAGLALVPEDRKSLGAILPLSISSNVSLAVLGRLGRAGRYNRRAERNVAERFRGLLGIRTRSLNATVLSLSGGNQQKVVLAKWLATEPKALILDEPTRGVDVGAKQEIYRLVQQLGQRGMAVMLISSEMEEILAVCDRVLVMHQGAIAGELTGGDVTEENIMRLAVGGVDTPHPNEVAANGTR
ncbi:MAG: sugar ABC transporter ATP-binding protein [Pirellulales bacterium]|nr:sugar ABC transporter ATP-binding protein [Pirellulales bacterium]